MNDLYESHKIHCKYKLTKNIEKWAMSDDHELNIKTLEKVIWFAQSAIAGEQLALGILDLADEDFDEFRATIGRA